MRPDQNLSLRQAPCYPAPVAAVQSDPDSVARLGLGRGHAAFLAGLLPVELRRSQTTCRGCQLGPRLRVQRASVCRPSEYLLQLTQKRARFVPLRRLSHSAAVRADGVRVFRLRLQSVAHRETLACSWRKGRVRSMPPFRFARKSRNLASAVCRRIHPDSQFGCHYADTSLRFSASPLPITPAPASPNTSVPLEARRSC